MRRLFFGAEDWAKQSGPSGGMAGRKSVSPEAEQQSGAAPSYLRDMADGRGVETYLVEQARVEPGGAWGVVGPEHDDRLSDHIRDRHRSPVTTVLRVVTVVTQDEEGIRGHAMRRDILLP